MMVNVTRHNVIFQKNTVMLLFNRIADEAKLQKRSDPVIATDLLTATLIAEALAEDLDCPLNELRPYGQGYIGDPGWLYRFDGIKIVALTPEICKHEVDGWREHFGPLAEIWS
jgi:hypothetical protein